MNNLIEDTTFEAQRSENRLMKQLRLNQDPRAMEKGESFEAMTKEYPSISSTTSKNQE